MKALAFVALLVLYACRSSVAAPDCGTEFGLFNYTLGQLNGAGQAVKYVPRDQLAAFDIFLDGLRKDMRLRYAAYTQCRGIR